MKKTIEQLVLEKNVNSCIDPLGIEFELFQHPLSKAIKMFSKFKKSLRYFCLLYL